MNSPGSADDGETNLAQDLLLALQSRTRNVVGAVIALLERGGVEDPVDRNIIGAAAAFAENPTENLQEIMGHTRHIGKVLGGYDMQEADPPAEIHAMHAHFFGLQCINRIQCVEAALQDVSFTNSPSINQAMAWALDDAKTLSRSYKDNSFLQAVEELRGRLARTE